MKKLLHYLANRRRPDFSDYGVFVWNFLRLFGWEAQLALLYQSDEPDDFRPHGTDSRWLALSGRYTARVRRDPRSEVVSLDLVDALAYRAYTRNALFNIELPPARDFAEAMIRFRWMSVTELVFDARKPLWLLTVHRA